MSFIDCRRRNFLCCGLFMVCGLLSFSGCNDSSVLPVGGDDEEPRELRKVVCTTGMVGDVVQAILGPEVDVTVLMKAGVDPHLFTPSPRDIATLSEADAIFFNGLHLEAGLSQTLENMAEDDRRFLYAMATGLTEKDGLIRVAADQFDPHFWNDLELWQKAARNLADKLGERYPERAEQYEERANSYCQQLQALLEESRRKIQEIPEERRVLISAHDAFEYFGRSLGLDVAAVQGISTNAEASVKKIELLVSRVVENEIPSIFSESSVSDKAIRANIAGCRQQGFEVKQGGTLYSDALGPEGTPADNFPGMFRSNVETIVEGLR